PRYVAGVAAVVWPPGEPRRRGRRRAQRDCQLRRPARRAGPAGGGGEPRSDGLAAAGPDPVAVHGRRPRPDPDVPLHARPQVAPVGGAAARAERVAVVLRGPTPPTVSS